jgi:hypothetical protein
MKKMRTWQTVVVVAFLAWALIPPGLVIASWLRSYLAPIEPVPRAFQIDLRAARDVPGRLVTIIATKQTPQKGDYFGHLWIAWPETPPLAPKGTREAGYYAVDQIQGLRTMAASVWAPWGFLTGHAPIPGTMKADDGWWRHLQIDVRVDEAAYQRALQVDTRWRSETRYGLRPGVKGIGPGRTWACQDYVFEVASALGLKADTRDWTQFPMGSFMDFAKANGIEVAQK